MAPPILLAPRHSSSELGSVLRAASSLAGSTDMIKALTDCSWARLSKPSLLCFLQEKFKFMLYFGEDIPKFLDWHDVLKLPQLVEGIGNEITHIGIQR